MEIKTNQFPELDEKEQVVRAYVGQDGCRCGCLGDYYATTHGVKTCPRFENDRREDKKVEKIIAKMKREAPKHGLIVYTWGFIGLTMPSGRVYSLYFNDN